MKLLTAYNYDPSNMRAGGGITYVHNLLTHMLDEGIEITLMGVKLSEEQSFEHENFEFIPVQEGTDKFWKFLLNLRKTVINLDRSDFDLVHTHNPLAMHPFIKKYPNTPKVVTLHGMPLDWVKVNYKSAYSPVSLVYKKIEKNIIENVDKITTAGPYTRMRLTKRYPELNLNDKIVSIPSGVDLNKFKPLNKEKLKKELNLDKYGEIIIFVGRLAEIKNLNLLIKSYLLFKNKFKNSTLIIVGRGEKVDEIKKFTKKLGLDSVVFTGSLESDMVVKYMNCADLLALTSIFEASPTVVKEALSCGVPIVSTNVGDVKHIITDPYLGEVVNSHNEKDFSDALIKMENLVKESPDEVRATCRKVACEKFSFENIASEFISLYKDLCTK
ncbi:MAG: Trehalose synthase [Candidatus Methanofastidiosum methylothiophilum]|uniref:Trehalose synthase n=1 Tax=Candidatus Methanofastidiosum methylothiophilum TaxID=1705564 RepID=A0A150IJU9_9EURY|nr:MAG: Trehalose synthase [Candidatus Methanofastidiosum methylthiophilus]KYC46937.1 MAG: Trehalose synthase [Candidatus Methanofastidiosum methylthiophilus]